MLSKPIIREMRGIVFIGFSLFSLFFSLISGTSECRQAAFLRGFVIDHALKLEQQDEVPKQALQESKNVESIQWRTGVELEKQVKLAISVTFEDAPLRDQLIKFSRHERIGLFVDRRVDSSQLVSFRAVDKTFEQILWLIAEEKDLGVCRLGNFYYVGPKEVAPKLQLLWPALIEEPEKIKKAGFDGKKKSAVEWPMLSEPGLILQRLSETHQFSVRQAKEESKAGDMGILPHDVWPEVLLPDLQVNEQIGLLLVGFGKWFELSNDGIQLVHFPQMDSGKFDWTLANPGNLLKRLKNEYPKIKFSLIKGKTIRATCSPDELASIQKFIIFDQRVEAGKEKVFTLNTTASRGQILNSIAQQTGRKFEYSSESKKVLDEQIKINVKEVSLEKLITAALEGSELKFKLEKERLLID